ncbi:MAG: hypothetical protein RLP44_24490 [Aggregatilineales bacterium]
METELKQTIEIKASYSSFSNWVSDLVTTQGSIDVHKRYGYEFIDKNIITLHFIFEECWVQIQVQIKSMKHLVLVVEPASNLNSVTTDEDIKRVHQVVHKLVDLIVQEWITVSPHNFHLLVANVDFAGVLRDRWNESEITQRNGAYLSTIILLGSVVEGLLLEKIKQNQEESNRSLASPKDEDGKPPNFNKWKFVELINVAHDCGWIDKEAKDFSNSLRDYRNLIHPAEQSRQKISPDEDTCKISRAVVNSVINDLLKGKHC